MAAAKKTVKAAKAEVKQTADVTEDAFAFTDVARDQYDQFVRRMSDASEEFRAQAEDAAEAMRST